MRRDHTRIDVEDIRIHFREVTDVAQTHFSEANTTREHALRLSREMIRNSANSIRASHRHEFDAAGELLSDVTKSVEEIETLREIQPAIYYSGYVEDAHKEYVEASIVLAIAQSSLPPTADELSVGIAPYLNGLAEAAGEFRRYILDSLRKDEFDRCEELLGIMDEIYSTLILMDFPDAITRGLRRNTDMVRGVLERTRSDLTLAMRQHKLEQTLDLFEQKMESNPT